MEPGTGPQSLKVQNRGQDLMSIHQNTEQASRQLLSVTPVITFHSRHPKLTVPTQDVTEWTENTQEAEAEAEAGPKGAGSCFWREGQRARSR